MKTKIILSVLVLFALSCMVSAVSCLAAVPSLVNYQGVLKDSIGAPYNGNATMVFSIWDDSTNGKKLWVETQDIVSVSHGLFNVLLGSSHTIPDSVFAQPNSWLQVIANGSELSPRRQIVSVGYAYRASEADTAEYARSALPSGVIVMWSGTIDDIPEGWALCDGTNGTPDLTDRFVKSVPNSLTDPGSTGGAATHNHGGETGSHTLTIAEMPAHNHSGTFGRYCQVGDPPNIAGYGNTAVDPYTVAVPSQGGDGGHAHTINSDSSLPPYYELAFIMKL